MTSEGRPSLCKPVSSTMSQLVVATLMDGIMRSVFPGEPRWTMLAAALMVVAAAAAMMLVRETDKGTKA